MSTTKFEHVIGKDGLHRIRKTRVENGEIIDTSHEGFSSREKAINNAGLVLKADLMFIGLPERLAGHLESELRVALWVNLPTLDERGRPELTHEFNPMNNRDKVIAPAVREPEADPLRHDRVFGKPNDPLEPQHPTEQIHDPST